MENKPNLMVSYCYRRLGKVERWREIAVNTDMCAPVCCGLKSVPMRPIDTKAAMVFTFHQHTHTQAHLRFTPRLYNAKMLLLLFYRKSVRQAIEIKREITRSRQKKGEQ